MKTWREMDDTELALALYAEIGEKNAPAHRDFSDRLAAKFMADHRSEPEWEVRIAALLGGAGNLTTGQAP